MRLYDQHPTQPYRFVVIAVTLLLIYTTPFIPLLSNHVHPLECYSMHASLISTVGIARPVFICSPLDSNP